MGTLYGGSAQTREGLEAWLGYALEAYRFMDRHLKGVFRGHLAHFARYVSRGEVFVTFREGKIAGMAIADRCQPEQVHLPVDSLVASWGEGVVLFCVLSLVSPKHRPHGAELLHEMLSSARERFPDVRFLAFRRPNTKDRVHLWELTEDGVEIPPEPVEASQEPSPEEESHG